jgi:nucleoid-associated protein YgaU
MKPGDYRVRIDDVDPVSGSVKSRAEVAFNVPPEIAVPLPPPAQPAVVPAPSSVAAAPGTAPPASVQSQGQPTAQTQKTPAQEAPSAPRNAQMASAEPREFARGTIVIPDISTAIVSRGDNLWRISQRIYGHGPRFTVIYGANQKQIRNPNLIYPGQVFVLPPEQGQKQGSDGKVQRGG